MTITSGKKAFGAGLISLDLVIGPEPESPIRAWTGGTCGNVLSILAYLGWDAYPIARMNNDLASNRVRADMKRWGVHVDWASCDPTSHTPMIVQEIRKRVGGQAHHRFSWSCPHCGTWLPPFKAITVNAADQIKVNLAGASVFFMDRLSRGILELAAEASAKGAVVVFEPSSKTTEKFLAEAFSHAHIVKYSDHRFPQLTGVMDRGTGVVLEIQTLGHNGLRYRHRLGRGVSKWIHLNAIDAPRLADTCGAGDWCTAGLISGVATGGYKDFAHIDAQGVRSALRYGQALASWNCGFEGARGGMYAVSKKEFESQISCLINGNVRLLTNTPARTIQNQIVTCPACPT